MAAIDVIIPFSSTGSKHDDRELRYALRSIEKHLSGYRDIIIVTDKLPDWLQGVRHIHAVDDPRHALRERNIMRKVMAACADESVSDTFLFTNDDIFLTKDIEVSQFPNHHKGTLADGLSWCSSSNPYRHTISNTIKALRAYGGGEFMHYDTHAPMLMDKHLFPEVSTRFRWDRGYGYCMKTLYACVAGLTGTFYPDCKLREEYSTDYYLNEVAAKRPYFSISDKTICPDFWAAMNILYPNKSRYEREDIRSVDSIRESGY